MIPKFGHRLAIFLVTVALVHMGCGGSPTSPSNVASVTNVPSVTLVASSLNPTGPFWVRADVTNVARIAHVDFWVDGSLYQRENFFPYSLFGDDNDGSPPRAGTLSAGAHTITARVYSDETTLVVTSPSITVTVEG